MLQLFDFPFGPLVLQVLVGLIGAGVVLWLRGGASGFGRGIAALAAGVAGSFVFDFVVGRGLVFPLAAAMRVSNPETVLHMLLGVSTLGGAAGAWIATRPARYGG